MRSSDKPKHKIWKWLKRLGLGFLGLLLVLLGLTTLYARIKDAHVLSNSPRDDVFVDVGGRRIHLHAMGQANGGPAVILIPCFNCDSSYWQAVQPKLAKTARVYAYDPAGFGWSDSAPAPLTPSRAADDLHTALVKLNEKRVILVGFSAGGLTVYNYYNRYPDNPQVVGLVWAEGDAVIPEELSWYNGKFDMVPIPRPLLPPLIELGIWRLGVDLSTSQIREQVPEDVRPMVDWDYFDRTFATEGTRKYIYAALGAVDAYPKDVQYTAGLPLPKNVPVFALKADFKPVFEQGYGDLTPEQLEEVRRLEPARTQWYKMIAANTPGGRYIPIANSAHMIVFEQPQMVIDAIRDMVKLVAGTEDQ